MLFEKSKELHKEYEKYKQSLKYNPNGSKQNRDRLKDLIMTATKKRENIQLFPQYSGWLKITSSLNNMILTFTDLSGKVKYSLSSGQKTNGKKGARSNYFVMLNTMTAICDLISKKEKNPKKINVSFKGHNLAEKLLTQGLKKKSIKVNILYNTTSVPHNGCRLKKYRRI